MTEFTRRLQENTTHPVGTPGGSEWLLGPWTPLSGPVHIQTIVLVRGLPGVGKTTLARTCFPERTLFEADMFADAPGVRTVADRHARCRHAIAGHLLSTPADLIICNTFTQAWELQGYLQALPVRLDGRLLVPVILALAPGHLTDADLARRTVHQVPVQAITAMRERWEPWPGEILLKSGEGVCASEAQRT